MYDNQINMTPIDAWNWILLLELEHDGGPHGMATSEDTRWPAPQNIPSLSR
jgi:hypothetical protein